MSNITLFPQTYAANYLGVSKATLESWRSLGKGPTYIKVGHFVRYTKADLDTWLESQRIVPRAS